MMEDIIPRKKSYEYLIFEKALDILRKNGKLTVDDIMYYFQVTSTMAYAVFRLLATHCEKTGECEKQKEFRKYVIVMKNRT